MDEGDDDTHASGKDGGIEGGGGGVGRGVETRFIGILSNARRTSSNPAHPNGNDCFIPSAGVELATRAHSQFTQLLAVNKPVDDKKDKNIKVGNIFYSS